MSKKIVSIILFLFNSGLFLSAQTPDYSKAGFWEIENNERKVSNFNIGWRLIKSPVEGAHAESFNDSDRKVDNCPHGLELVPTEASSSKNYQGEAWYRKHFTIPEILEKEINSLRLKKVERQQQEFEGGEK